nr:META domain-containing protein [Propionicimonas sp.]
MSKRWLLSVGLVALLAACTSTTPAAPAPAAPTLDGTSWTVTALNGAAPLAGHEPTMEFAGAQVAGSASCNRYNAGFTQDQTRVTITPGILTQMACAEDVMTQEHAFTVALTQVAGVRETGAGVELVDASAKAVLTLARVVDKPLEGTDWELNGLVTGDAVESVPGLVTMKIADGELTGKACNTFRGEVTAADGAFRAGPLASTKMICQQAGLSDLETTVLKTLQAATSYAIKGNTLTISADGSGLVFTAA